MVWGFEFVEFPRELMSADSEALQSFVSACEDTAQNKVRVAMEIAALSGVNEQLKVVRDTKQVLIRIDWRRERGCLVLEVRRRSLSDTITLYHRNLQTLFVGPLGEAFCQRRELARRVEALYLSMRDRKSVV